LAGCEEEPTDDKLVVNLFWKSYNFYLSFLLT
jgi:hypothetical protein